MDVLAMYTGNYKEHPMTHQKRTYDDAMTNSQKPEPKAEGDKKTTTDSADYYNGDTQANTDEVYFGF